MIRKVINRGRGPQPKTDRNIRIARDYKNDIDPRIIAEKNGITRIRVYAILKQMGVAVKKPAKKSDSDSVKN